MPSTPDLAFPISFFLVFFGIFLLFYAVYSAFNLYHLLRFGIDGFGLYLIVTVYTGGSLVLAAAAFYLLSQYDWSVPFAIGNIFGASETSIFKGL
mgnify:CR=1 FL=1